LLHACMTAASQFMEFWFKWELPLPVPSDTVLGKNMGEENKCNSEAFKARSKELHDSITAEYCPGHQPSWLR